MLYLLEIENFYSIRTKQIVDLRIGEAVGDEPGRFDALFLGSKDRAARVVAFFGPNASGKSTVLKALAFIGWFTSNSFQLAPNATLPCERFLDAEALKEPMRLAVEFGGPLDPTLGQADEHTAYGTWRYELVIHGTQGRYVVRSEALKQRAGGRGKWVRVFDRRSDRVLGGKAFGLAGYAKVIDKVRDNASLISTLAQFDHKPSLRLRDAAQSIVANILIDRNEVSDPDAIRFYATNSAPMEALNREIGRIDLGIKRMHIQQLATGPMAYFDHEGLLEAMPWHLESHGTRNFIKYFPLIHAALQNGGVAVIDEIDVSIHPLVLPEILRWFHDEARNTKRAQLWVSCHAASLLEDLLKEEIFFCEKDNHGRTSIYGLQDIQDVRRTDNRYRKYLSGVYGAVPQLG
jgi:AAA15 family ATPase/GTPase